MSLTRVALVAAGAAAAAAGPCALSNVFGDHMVLQSHKPAMLFGFASPGTSVTTTFQGAKYVAPAGADGVWRQQLLAQPPSLNPQSVSFSCSTGEAFALNDVLFGEVVLCGGQSNQQFTLSQLGEQGGFSASAEIAAAAAYPWVRTVTVGQTTTSYSPLQQLAVPPIQPWASVSDPAVIGQGNWSATSAACWFYARALTDYIHAPIGMISSNWGGTIIQSWATNATNAACGITRAGAPGSSLPEGAANTAAEYVTPGYEASVAAGPDPNTGFGVLYNAMIAPYVVGPMALSSFTWFQVGPARLVTTRPSSSPRPYPPPLTPTAPPRARATTARTRCTSACSPA